MKRTIKLAALAIAAVIILSGCMTNFGSAGGNAACNLELSYGATVTDFLLSAIIPVVSWGTYTAGESIQ